MTGYGAANVLLHGKRALRMGLMRDTRGELLAEAEVLVRSRGYSGFSYADLAAVVGVSKPAIHHHFRTKEDLALAMVATYGERYEAALCAIRADVPGAVARIEAYGRLYLDGLERGLGCLCAALAVELDTLPEGLKVELSAFFDRHIGWLGEVIAEGLVEGEMRTGLDPAEAARLVVATLEGALLMERLLSGSAGFASVTNTLTRMLRP